MCIVRKAMKIGKEEGIRTLGRKAYRRGIDEILSLPAINNLAYKLSVKKLKDRMKQEKDLSDIVETAFSFRGYGPYRSIRPAQIRNELTELAGMVKDEDPSIVMEIGTANGGTFYVLARYLDYTSTLISLDLPGGEFGGGYSEDLVPFFENFAEDKELAFFRENSHDIKTKRRIEKHLSGKKIDFLFIDGDHTYEGVKQDYEMYKPLVSGDGIIAFHDIVSGPLEKVGGVPDFWSEIKKSFYSREIVKSWDQEGYGIGVIYQ